MSNDGFDDECLFDEVNGRKRKSVLSLLNKGKLGKHEMDEIFCME